MKVFAVLFSVLGFSHFAWGDVVKCNVRVPQVVQQIAQINGAPANQIVSTWSETVFLVTVDNTQQYAVEASGDGPGCIVKHLMFRSLAKGSGGVTVAACASRARASAGAFARQNGLAATDIHVDTEKGGLFAITVDNAQKYTVDTSNDDSCWIEDVHLETTP